MTSSLAALLLFAAGVLAAATAARWIGREIDRRLLCGMALLPLLFVAPGFFANRTILPVDHALMLAPWSSIPHEPARNGNLNDAATQMAPWAKAVRLSFRDRSFPWLDRWNGCGTPLFANGQSAPFSPFTLAGLLLPLHQAFNVAVAWKLFFALSGTWLWLGELGLSKSAAAFGSVAFSFSLTMTPWLLYPHTAVIGFWPWTLFLGERLARKNTSPRAFTALVALLAVQPLLGHIESVVLGALFALCWLALRATSGEQGVGRALSGLVAAGVAAAGLAAFVLVPQALAIRASNRAALAAVPLYSPGFSWLPRLPVWSRGFVTVLFPRTLGDAVASPMIPGAGWSFSEMALGSFGIVGFAVVLLIARPGSRRGPAEWILFGLTLFGVAAATGLWPVAELLGHVPVLRLMIPIRFFSWTALAGSAVAAFEIDRLRNDLTENSRASLWLPLSASLLAIAAIATYRAYRPMHAAAGGLLSQQRSLAATLLLLAAVAVAGAAAAGKRQSWLAPCLAALLLAELFYQGRRLYRFGSPANLFPDTPLLTFLRSRPGTFRVTGEGASLFPNSNVFAGLEEVRTHDPTERREYVTFLDRACGYPPAEYFKFLGNFNAPALDFLNVRYFVAAPGRAAPGEKWSPVYSASDGTVFENAKCEPRVFLLPPASGSISELRETTNGVTFRSDLNAAAGGLAAASYVDDGGWRARDDEGHRLAISRFNGPFLALSLPPGAHRVTLTYLPPGLPAGLSVSAATLALLAAAAFFARRIVPG